MTRWEHFLAPTSGAVYPAQVIAAECVGRYQPVGRYATVEAEVLVSWHCATMHGSQGSYGKAKTWSGDTSLSFWKSVTQYMERGCQTYLLLWRAQRNASLLNLWHLLESGILSLVKSSSGETSGKRLRWSKTDARVCVSEDPPTIITVYAPGQRGSLTILDTRNFGIDRDTLPADPMQWCVELLTWFRSASKAMIRGKLGGWKATAASQAYHSWRYCGLKHSVLAHTTASALDLERRAYYGGRCECFQIGSVEGPIYHLDFRNLYPYECTSTSIPVRLIGAWKDYQSIPPHILDGNPGLIADVTIRTDAPDYPVRRDGMTFWPIGRFRTVLAEPELRHCEQMQRICKYHCISAYETAPAMREWILKWYAVRKEADIAKDRHVSTWAKRIMVSLAGKLGQKASSWVQEPEVVADYPWQSWYVVGADGKLIRYRAMDWEVQRESVEPNGADAIPAMAAYITSAARMRLQKALDCAGRENVYYCDTDSLICNAEAHLRLLQGHWIRRGQIGYLQEKGVHSTADFFGVKHYALDGEIKCSGMPQGPLSAGPTAGTIWYQLHSRSALRNGTAPQSARQLRPYERDDVYRIGRVTQSGRVIPLKIGE